MSAKEKEEVYSKLQGIRDSMKEQLDQMKGLFDRKIIVLPHLVESCWACTFVFNAGSALPFGPGPGSQNEPLDMYNKYEGLRPMFLYYDLTKRIAHLVGMIYHVCLGCTVFSTLLLITLSRPPAQGRCPLGLDLTKRGEVLEQ